MSDRWACSEIPRGIYVEWDDEATFLRQVEHSLRAADDRGAPMLWTAPCVMPRYCVGFYGEVIRLRAASWGEFTDWNVVRPYHAKYPLRHAIGG